MVGVELTHSCPADPHGTGRNDEHIRVFGHGREGRIGILEHEFSVGVLLPGGQHSLLVEREVAHWELLSTADGICRLGRGIVGDEPRCVKILGGSFPLLLSLQSLMTLPSLRGRKMPNSSCFSVRARWQAS